MHAYSIDKDIRLKVVVGIFLISLIISYLLHKFVIVKLNLIEEISFVADISSLTIYGFLLYLFDKIIWKWFVKLRIIKIPILSGTWKGTYKSSKNGFENETVNLCVIKQTFFNMLICFKNEGSSQSYSEMACILNNKTIDPILMYEYVNEPPDKNLPWHRGTCSLTLTESGQVLKGEYYNESRNGHWGKIYLQKSL